MPIFCASCANQLGHGVARENYNLITMLPTFVCDECALLIEAEKKRRQGAGDTPHPGK
jgi:hypothetical protein